MDKFFNVEYVPKLVKGHLNIHLADRASNQNTFLISQSHVVVELEESPLLDSKALGLSA